MPNNLSGLIPDHVGDDKAVIEFLRREFGKRSLRDNLVNHFVAIGESVQDRVELHWLFMGLDYQRRSDMGMALQRLLVQIDGRACEQDWTQAQGRFVVGNRQCAIELDSPIRLRITERVRNDIALCPTTALRP